MNTLIPAILSYIGLPLFLLVSAKTKAKSMLSIDFSNTMKGFFAIYIAVHHFAQNTTNPYVFPFLYTGGICVSFFFFISGYGLRLSYDCNSLNSFWAKRITRIYVPFIIICFAVAFLYRIIGNQRFTLKQIVFSALTLRNIYDQRTPWYLFSQIIMYFGFYLVFKTTKIKRKNGCLVVFALVYMLVMYIVGKPSYYYTTVLAFPFGCIIAMYKDEVEKIVDSHYYMLLIGAFVLSFFYYCLKVAQLFVLYADIALSIVFPAFLIILSCRIDFKSKLLSILGQSSLEYYVYQFPAICET